MTDSTPAPAELAALLAEHLNTGCDDWRCEVQRISAQSGASVDEPMVEHLAEIVIGEPLGCVVRDISDAIDEAYPQDLSDEAHLWRRCMKVVEEAGEVTEAILGTLGENPRKGTTHTMQDVRAELLDVALAALGAVAHIDDADPVALLDAHARSVHGRLVRALADAGTDR